MVKEQLIFDSMINRWGGVFNFSKMNFTPLIQSNK